MGSELENLDEFDKFMAEDEKPDSAISLEEMESFFEKYAKVDDAYEIACEAKTELYKELTALELRASEYLDSVGLDKYTSKYGTFSFRREISFLTPKTNEEKEAFGNWLKERDIYEQYRTFNSISINSLAKREVEATGDPFLELPGLKRGQPVLKSSFRKFRHKN